MDSSPTTLFDSYEQDFKQFIETIREKLEGDKDQDGGKFTRLLLLPMTSL
jgi:vesicle transport through interaction with t-SNAREs 1